MSDEQSKPAEAAPVAAAEPATAVPSSQPYTGPERRKLWSAAEVWVLGVFSVIGLVGFIATFALIMVRSPSAPVQRTMTAAETQRLIGPAGERGPAGPAGPRGAPGDAAVRVVRPDCGSGTGSCTADCADDEVLLSAYCSPGRTQAVFPTDHSALCRLTGRGRADVVAFCVKGRR